MRELNKKFEANIWINSVESMNLWLNLNNSLVGRSRNQVDVDIKSSIVSNLNNSLSNNLKYGITYMMDSRLNTKESHDV